MFLISDAYAQAAPAAAGGGQSLFATMMPLLLMFVVLYFLMIRPQMKRQKEHRAMMDGLQAGDEVVAVGGIVGKVVAVKDGYVTLEVSSVGDKSVEIMVQKPAVQVLLPKGTIKSL